MVSLFILTIMLDRSDRTVSYKLLPAWLLAILVPWGRLGFGQPPPRFERALINRNIYWAPILNLSLCTVAATHQFVLHAITSSWFSSRALLSFAGHWLSLHPG